MGDDRLDANQNALRNDRSPGATRGLFSLWEEKPRVALHPGYVSDAEPQLCFAMTSMILL